MSKIFTRLVLVAVVLCMGYVITGCKTKISVQSGAKLEQLRDVEQINKREFVQNILPSATEDEQEVLREKFGIGCADMGFPIYDSVRNRTLMFFGDTFQGTSGNSFVMPWQSNIMLVSHDNDISDGITFDSFYTKQGIQTVANHSLGATAIIQGLHRGQKSGGTESSKIPTGGIEIDGNIYMFYFSVLTSEFRQDRMNYGGCVKSSDGGETWVKLNNLSWANHASGTNSEFYETDSNGEICKANDATVIKQLMEQDINNQTVGINIDINKHEGHFYTQICPVDGRDGYIYLLGEGGYRTTGVKLARVRKEKFEDFDTYEYLTGFDGERPIFERGKAGLSKQNKKGTATIPSVGYIFGSDELTDPNSGCGEVNCIYNEYLGKWMVSYLRSTQAGKGGIMYRLADNIWGPYSDPVSLFRYADSSMLPRDSAGNVVTAIYGGMLSDRWVENNGQIVYVVLSQYQNVQSKPRLYTSSIVKISFNTKNYIISFNGNGGEGDMTETEALYGVKLKVPNSGYSRECAVFKEWNTKPDGTGKGYRVGSEIVYNTRDLSEDRIELFAIWIDENKNDSTDTSDSPNSEFPIVMVAVCGGVIGAGIIAIVTTAIVRRRNKGE